MLATLLSHHATPASCSGRNSSPVSIPCQVVCFSRLPLESSFVSHVPDQYPHEPNIHSTICQTTLKLHFSLSSPPPSPMVSSRNFSILVIIFAVLSAVDAANCTHTEGDNVETYVPQYGKGLGINCKMDACSTDCVASITKLADLLPDCEYEDVNYHLQLAEGVNACGANNGLSSMTSGSAKVCSPAEAAVTTTVMAAYDGDFLSICLDDKCSRDCLEIQSSIAVGIPDCFDTAQEINFHDTVEEVMSWCNMSSTAGSGYLTTESVGSASSSATTKTKSSSATGVPSLSASSILVLIAIASLVV